MARRKGKSRPSKETEDTALYIAMVVRNALEDFHCRHLSDQQMKELMKQNLKNDSSLTEKVKQLQKSMNKIKSDTQNNEN